MVYFNDSKLIEAIEEKNDNLIFNSVTYIRNVLVDSWANKEFENFEVVLILADQYVSRSIRKAKEIEYHNSDIDSIKYLIDTFYQLYKIYLEDKSVDEAIAGPFEESFLLLFKDDLHRKIEYKDIPEYFKLTAKNFLTKSVLETNGKYYYLSSAGIRYMKNHMKLNQ